MKNNKKRILQIVCLAVLLVLLILAVVLWSGKGSEDADKKQDDAAEELFIDASDWLPEDEDTPDLEEDVVPDLGEENDTFGETDDNITGSSDKDDTNSQNVPSPNPTVSNNLQDKEEHKGWFYNFCF